MAVQLPDLSRVDSRLNPELAVDGLAFILPLYGGFVYGHRAARSFFKYTPDSLNPVCITLDDGTPQFAAQDWELWHSGMPRERCLLHHFANNGGLTRSWNAGLLAAQKLGCRYAIAGN